MRKIFINLVNASLRRIIRLMLQKLLFHPAQEDKRNHSSTIFDESPNLRTTFNIAI